jgi:hypothetical protein
MDAQFAGGPPLTGSGRHAFAPDRPLTERHATLIAGALPVTAGIPTVPGVRFGVQRARDLLVLDVEARGMRLLTATEGDPVLVVIAKHAGSARLIATFPPQHIGEQAWQESETVGHDVLARARFARFSRLVYEVPVGEQIAFSSEGVLAAMRRLALVVVPNATPRSSASTGGLSGAIALPGGITFASSALGHVLTESDVAVQATGVDHALQASAALRSVRVRLDRAAALDIRPGAAGLASPKATPGEQGLLGPGGLVVLQPGPIVQQPGPIEVLAKAREPRPDETAIEAPWRLVLSPSDREGFTHADVPVGPSDPVAALEPPTARERIELWHSRIGVRRPATTPDGDPTVSIDERPDSQRIVRAIWARERELSADPNRDLLGPFRSSLRPHDRWQLVKQSSEDVTSAKPKTHIAPRPVDVKGLALSSLGAWLDVHGSWDALAYDAISTADPQGSRPALLSWDHLAPMGRDQFVKVVEVGFLYPLGHKAVLIRQTERKIKSATNPVARLFQRQYIVVAEPERTHAVHDLPFTNVRFLTLITPDLEDNATPIFWPKLDLGPGKSGPDVIFSVETIDHDGRHARLRMPLLFLQAAHVVGQTATVAPYGPSYRADSRARVAADGQKIAFARAKRPGDTSADVIALRLDATLEGPAGAGRRLQPRLRAAEIVPATTKLLTPDSPPFHVDYDPIFKDGGFDGPGKNDAELFLRVIDSALANLTGAGLPAAPSQADLPRVTFGSTERSGGFVDPAQKIAGLTRALGTVGDVNGAKAGKFIPTDLLDALPKLFGLFKLTQVLSPLGLDLEHAPKFVTEALGPIQGLLADLAALRDAIERAPELNDVALQIAGLVEDLTDAVTAMLALAATPDPTLISAKLAALTTPLDQLTGRVAMLPLLAKTELDKLLRSLRPYVADAAKIAAAVDQVLAFVQGLDPTSLEVRAKLAWTVPVEGFPKGPDPIFRPQQPLRISVESRAGVKTGASFDAVAELTDFDLVLVAPASLMELHFDRIAFRAGSSGKPDVDVVFGEIVFVGPLSFIEVIKDLIPMDGFSDPPFLDVSAQGVRAGFTLGLPNVAVGVFALQNMSLGADCHVPFLGESVSVGFNFCTRERPFALTVAFIGGGGFFGLRISPNGLDVLELSLEAGARLAVDLGVASGSIEAMLGIYMRLEGQGGSLTGYFRLRGEVDVLGLISASIELSLELTYEFATGKMVGRAKIKIEVEVFMFSFSVSVSCERRFAGSNGDPTFAEVLELGPDGSSVLWDDYCDAFA